MSFDLYFIKLMKYVYLICINYLYIMDQVEQFQTQLEKEIHQNGLLIKKLISLIPTEEIKCDLYRLNKELEIECNTVVELEITSDQIRMIMQTKENENVTVLCYGGKDGNYHCRCLENEIFTKLYGAFNAKVILIQEKILY